MPKFKKRPLLLVEWEDACHYTSWTDAKNCKDDRPLMTRSVGWKVPSAKNCITVVGSHNEYDDVSGREVIPRKYIKSIRRLG